MYPEKHVWSAAGCLYDIYHVKANTLKVFEAASGARSSSRGALSSVTVANKKRRETENGEEEGNAVKERDFSSECRTCEMYLALLQLFLSAT